MKMSKYSNLMQKIGNKNLVWATDLETDGVGTQDQQAGWKWTRQVMFKKWDRNRIKEFNVAEFSVKHRNILNMQYAKLSQSDVPTLLG